MSIDKRWSLLAIPLASFMYRFRGGLFNPGNLLGWASWGTFITIPMLLLTTWWQAVLTGVLHFAAKFWPHGRYFTLDGSGPNKNDYLSFMLGSLTDPWRSVVAMFVIGVGRSLIALAPLANWLWLAPAAVASGLAHVLAYWIGKVTTPDNRTQTAEWIYGPFVAAAAIALAW